MKLREFYERAIEKGVKEDPRRKGAVDTDLKKAKAEYRKLKGVEKKSFDREKMVNPYADSRILNGTGNEEIKTVLVGIDIDVAEILLADRLCDKGMKIDLVLSHHPSGRAFSQLDEVMSIQCGIWETLGFTREIAEGLMKGRRDEVARTIASRNHMRAVDAAKLLGIPFMCLHTVADNCVARYLQNIFDTEKPEKIKGVLNILKRVPEYRHAMRTSGAGPNILAGEAKSGAGKIFVDMTGGTSPPDGVLARLSQSGIKTIVGMHARESAYKIVKSEFLNYVIAGHMASDNLGVNLLLDAIDRGGNLKVVCCSGFKRLKR
ncbi:MAG: NGG1p interacting factor NIF3 [Candidatus Omnitrophica bacterium]|nr:NGG1p interacting factor NIF3 [Candidatus Omnitrophota bacterium]